MRCDTQVGPLFARRWRELRSGFVIRAFLAAHTRPNMRVLRMCAVSSIAPLSLLIWYYSQRPPPARPPTWTGTAAPRPRPARTNKEVGLSGTNKYVLILYRLRLRLGVHVRLLTKKCRKGNNCIPQVGLLRARHRRELRSGCVIRASSDRKRQIRVDFVNAGCVPVRL